MVRAPVDDEHSAKPAGAEFWHRWIIYFPRRSITGKLLWGSVWRRHDARHWTYSGSPTLTHHNQRRPDRNAAKKLVDPTDRPCHVGGAVSAGLGFLIAAARPGQPS